MRDDSTAAVAGLYPPNQGRRLVVLFVVCALAGMTADVLGVPLPWMIGPMLAGVAISLSGQAPFLHRSARGVGQLLVAAAIGLHFTPSALSQAVVNLPYMAGAAIIATLAGCAIAFLMLRLTSGDIATAFFASIPGGPGEMAQIAEQYGGNAALVAVAQSLRIAMVVIIIPVSLAIANAGSASVEAVAMPVVGAAELVMVLVVALLFALVFRRWGIVSPLFMGPLAASAIFAGAGFYDFAFPRPLIYGGQLLLGASLGLSFTRELLSQAPRFLGVSVSLTGLLMAFCAFMGYVISELTSWDLATMVLATAPGSLTEMSITAESMGLGVAGVAAFQIVRLFVMVPLTPMLFRLASRWFVPSQP